MKTDDGATRLWLDALVLLMAYAPGTPAIASIGGLTAREDVATIDVSHL